MLDRAQQKDAALFIAEDAFASIVTWSDLPILLGISGAPEHLDRGSGLNGRMAPLRRRNRQHREQDQHWNAVCGGRLSGACSLFRNGRNHAARREDANRIKLRIDRGAQARLYGCTSNDPEWVECGH